MLSMKAAVDLNRGRDGMSDEIFIYNSRPSDLCCRFVGNLQVGR